MVIHIVVVRKMIESAGMQGPLEQLGHGRGKSVHGVYDFQRDEEACVYLYLYRGKEVGEAQ